MKKIIRITGMVLLALLIIIQFFQTEKNRFPERERLGTLSSSHMRIKKKNKFKRILQ